MFTFSHFVCRQIPSEVFVNISVQNTKFDIFRSVRNNVHWATVVVAKKGKSLSSHLDLPDACTVMLLQLVFLLLFTPASVRPEWDSNLQPSNIHDELLENGLLFHERGKILLAEKFVPVEFMIPFPTYDFALKHEIERTLDRLDSMWDLPSPFCPLNCSSGINSNSTYFNVNWILVQINHEINEAANDVIFLRNETSAFLSLPSPQRASRQKRGASAGAVALAAVGLFGGGVALGSSGSCGLHGIFGTNECREYSTPLRFPRYPISIRHQILK